MINFVYEGGKDKLVKVLCDENIQPRLSFSSINKLLRKKDIKVNGKRVKDNVDVFNGDEIVVYNTTDMEKPSTEGLVIKFEDDNIIIVDKPVGVEVLNDTKYNLTAMVNEFLKEKGIEIKAKPMHRLDRNTCGLVIFAKNKTAETELYQAFKTRTIKKFYFATVEKVPTFKEKTFKAYLFKDSKKSMSYISEEPQKGYVPIATRFRVLKSYSNKADMEIELITGKTHQIRAHLAYLGHPIIGDGKYSKLNDKNKNSFNLVAYKIIFNFEKGTPLYYLNGKVITR